MRKKQDGLFLSASLLILTAWLIPLMACPVTEETNLTNRNPIGYDLYVVKSFKHKGLETFFYTGSKKGIKADHASRIERILDRLNAASEIKDMSYPGSNLHELRGDKAGLYSVKVSGNWRIFFEFKEGDAYIVDYADYH